MGMPVIVEITDDADPGIFTKIFDYFRWVDSTFSTYKETSEITRINTGVLKRKNYSKEMSEIFALAQQTKKESHGYFDIHNGKVIDPSGIVKGWAIHNAARILTDSGIGNYYVEAGGDIEVAGTNNDGKPWTIGIRNPFSPGEIIKRVTLGHHGIATSGTYERGNHIYDPVRKGAADEIASMTVIAPDVYEADRFATAAFAMGTMGIQFISGLKNTEGYMIYNHGIATYTAGFGTYTV